MAASYLRWGIIGCGDVVVRKSGPSLQKAGRSEIVAIMRRDTTRLKKFATDYDVAFISESPDAIVQHPEVDIVYVATPPSSHEDYTLLAANAGKHVLVEKPMAMSAVQARRMIDACSEAGVQLFVAYYRRFHPQVLKMHALLDEGAIGLPRCSFIDLAASAPPPSPGYWRYDPAVAGGGSFVDVGSHRLDAMISLLGPVRTATGLSCVVNPDMRVEEIVSATVEFESGTLCTASGDFVSGRTSDRFEIYGTAGALTATCFDGRSFIHSSEKNITEYAFEMEGAPHLGLIQHIETVLLDGRHNGSSGTDALNTELVLDAAVRGDALQRLVD